MLHNILKQTIKNRPQEQKARAMEGLDVGLKNVVNAKSIREEFESLSHTWVPPTTTGFESTEAASQSTQS